MNNRTPFQRRLGRAGIVLLLACTLAACNVFDVKNPGKILDEDLNNERAIRALVVGMSADFSVVYDDLGFIVARLSDEMAASGSYFLSTRARFGIIESDDTDFYWEGLHQARFVAENGLVRMEDVLGDQFNGNPLTARAYFFAGLANRALGEAFCQVTYEGSEPLPKAAAFERAVGHFTNAISQAQQAGENDLLLAAYGGRAQAHVGLGDWASAVADAQQLSTDFAYEAIYSDNSGRESNEIYDETHQRYEMSAFGALAGSFDPPDPRAPYTDCRVDDDCSTNIGADGSTFHLRQEKYNALGSNIPVVKGTEMRLIEAEALWEQGNLDAAMAKINEVRAFFDLDPLTATTREEVFDVLDKERHLTLWLEGRRLFDLHRWDHPFLRGGGVVYEGIDNRASCLPIADSECQTNPNVSC